MAMSRAREKAKARARAKASSASPLQIPRLRDLHPQPFRPRLILLTRRHSRDLHLLHVGLNVSSAAASEPKQKTARQSGIQSRGTTLTLLTVTGSGCLHRLVPFRRPLLIKILRIQKRRRFQEFLRRQEHQRLRSTSRGFAFRKVVNLKTCLPSTKCKFRTSSRSVPKAK